MNKDTLTTCRRCGGNACYEQQVSPEAKTWMCMGCGFSTSSDLKGNSELATQTLETAPELYRDLLHIDDEDYRWFPATITLPGQGMVFVDGSSKDDWQWSAVKAIEINDEDRKTKTYPEGQTHRMDMKNAKKFGQKDFMDALEDIGFFNNSNPL